MGILDNFTQSREKHDDVLEPYSYADNDAVVEGVVSENHDDLQRRLGNRQIQLLAIGGSIGTALFVSIGGGLAAGGLGSLFIAYTIYSCMLALVNNCVAEMTAFMPVSGGFIRLAGEWVDDAVGFTAGWNFFLYEALLITFKITALCAVLKFWRDDIPYAAVIAVPIVLYALLNVLAVRADGEAELTCFTFLTMCGGNPNHDAYGFRYWNHPGPFAEHLSTGTLGRSEGFLASVWSACFCIVGPEYCSMAAAEAKRPRIYVKNAFKTVYWRFCPFFIVGALAIGVLIAYNDPKLLDVLNGGKGAGTASASPYVIAMQHLGVTGLPHLVNTLLVTSIFSAGNTYTYCATRSLYGLALEGRAPKVLRYCTKQGIPLFCFAIVMVFPCLAFLHLSSGSAKVLTWLVNLVTAGGLINYITMSLTYIYFYRALQAQGIDRKTLPYYGYFQPYCAYVGLAWMTIMVFCYGYSSFKPWSADSFFTYYTMLIVAPVLFIFWKLLKRTRNVAAHEADLVWERPVIDAYEATFIDPPVGFWREMGQLVGIGYIPGGNDKRQGSASA